MTREQQTSKNHFRLNAGLNTEMSEIGFQDGFTTDEANYELLVDGSRRRRKGLAVESGASAAKTVSTFNTGERCQTYLWENVGGDPNKSVMVFRKGVLLYFADADETISNGWASGTGSYVSLAGFYSDDGTDALMRAEPVSFSQGRGHLFVSSRYVLPFFVTYDSATGYYSPEEIPIRIRDYKTIDDGTSVKNEPTDATIPADHKYNLRNRGWPQDRIDQYKTDQSKWPARNQIWYKGYKRTSDTTVGAGAVNPEDGTYSWDSAKLDAEVFGASDAPLGSIWIEPKDTTLGYGNESVADVLYPTAHAYDGVNTHTFTVSNSLSPGDTVVISGNSFTYDFLDPEESEVLPGVGTLNGSWTVATASGTQFTITKIILFYNGNFSSTTIGNVDTGGSLARSSGTDHGDAPKAIEFHQGRVFYAGWENTEFADYILFSQIADEDDKYRKCYQEADPTDPNFNSLTTADGGYLVIPGMAGVRQMVSVRGSLLVFTNKGVWEVNGGRSGVFTANGYQVRKVTDSPCNSNTTPIAIENTVLYTGPGGIYVIAPNQYTGILEAQNISEFTIQTLWNQITDAEQEYMQSAYDSAMKRLYLMYGPSSTTSAIDTMLIYDVRSSAWFKYTFDTPADNVLLTGFSIQNADDTSDNKKMKFIYQVSTTSVQVADFDQTSFDDWDGTNGPLPYMYTGWDNLGDFQRRRQAPVITVFQKRTETGFTEASGVYTAVNPSSTLMSGYWDWTSDDTNEATTNKITATQEVYRHVRAFAPSATTDLDGYPVVVTRNKLRGRGRVLQLKFEGATDKDSHILGFTTNYKVSRRK